MSFATFSRVNLFYYKCIEKFLEGSPILSNNSLPLKKFKNIWITLKLFRSPVPGKHIHYNLIQTSVGRVQNDIRYDHSEQMKKIHKKCSNHQLNIQQIWVALDMNAESCEGLSC